MILSVEAIAKSVAEVAKYDADDWFVIAITVRGYETPCSLG